MASLAGCSSGSVTRAVVKSRHHFLDEHTPVIATSNMQITWTYRGEKGLGPRFGIDVIGEAAFCSFTSLARVFVPQMAWNAPSRSAVSILQEQLINFNKLDRFDQADAIRTIPSMKQVVEIQKEEWPWLLRFENIDEPSSVVELDREDLFPRSGRKIRMVRSTLQVTDEPITREITKELKWVRTLKSTVGGGHSVKPNGPAKDRLSQFHFMSWY